MNFLQALELLFICDDLMFLGLYAEIAEVIAGISKAGLILYMFLIIHVIGETICCVTLCLVLHSVGAVEGFDLD